MSRAQLEVRGLDHAFGGLQAVSDVSFEVPERSITALIGPNGAGKTTLFNLISGLLRPDRGSIRLDGQELTGLAAHRIAGLGIARTFQTVRLFPRLSALENVMVGRHTRSRAGFLAGMLNLPWTWREERAIRAKARELLLELGLAECAGEAAGSLSFRHQRLVEIARALASEPRLLLLDEPAAGLNLQETEELASLICRIRDRGITVLLVEHDMSLVMDISDLVIVLNYGRKLAEGAPAEIQRDPEVIKIYLGGNHA
jgi:branched-chain amino acid transport system ATP-binding protein